MIGATYQRCSRGCGLICNHENVQDHERHCTGEERLEDCLGLPDVPNIRWHQTNAEETETANLPENLENLVVCVDDAYGPKTGPPSLIFCILSRRTAVQDSRPCGGGVSGVGRSLGVGGGHVVTFLFVAISTKPFLHCLSVLRWNLQDACDATLLSSSWNLPSALAGNRIVCARDFGSLVHGMARLACAQGAPPIQSDH